MKIDNISTSQSFKSIKFISSPSFAPSARFLKKAELKTVNSDLKKIVENAPLLKKLGEKSDVFVCHYKVKNSNMHVLKIDFLEEKPPYDFGIGEFYHESIQLGHGDSSDQGFFNHVAKVFDVLTNDFEKFKSDRYMDNLFLKNPQQVITFIHHGKVNITD